MEWTALLLGFAASLHCMLMCSPLALAVSAAGVNPLRRQLIYNSGRLVTYGILGMLITSLGATIDLSGFHLIFTIGVAVTLIMMGILGLSSIRVPLLSAGAAKFTGIIKIWFGAFLKRKSPLSVFMLGMINGLLPCGMVYLALAYCLTLAGPISGFNFMILFGLGTLPAMLGLTSGLNVLMKRFRFNPAHVMRYGLIVLGLLVLTRLFMMPHFGMDHTVSAAGILFCQ